MPTRLHWVAQAFFELSNKRGWTGTFGGAVPQAIDEPAIRFHFDAILGLSSASLFAAFRRWINAMDAAWQTDWAEKAKARAEQDRQRSDEKRRAAPV